MFLREAPNVTIADLREQVEASHDIVVQAPTTQVRVDLEGGAITIGSEVEVPATSDAVKALGDWLQIPHQFLLRQEADIQQFLLQTRLDRTPAPAAFVYTLDGGLREVREPNLRVIPVPRLLEVAEKVIDPAAPVSDFWTSADEFRLDIMVPDNFDRGIGGDPQDTRFSQVGDLSKAGVRMFQDRKHNLAPQVQPFQYRLLCTNGMTTRDDGLKIDARGNTVEEVLAEFEAAADRAFRRAESDMAAFYDLRNQRVENAERTLLRLGNEAGLPTRTIIRLQERVPVMMQEEGLEAADVTMFHLVNLITNQANDPSINRSGVRSGLQSVGGTIVNEHADRCTACNSKVVVH